MNIKIIVYEQTQPFISHAERIISIS